MKLGDGTRGQQAAVKASDCAPLATVSLGLASMVVATTGAAAQQAAEPAPLPPLEVTTKQAKKKSVSKKAPTKQAAPAPVVEQEPAQQHQPEPAFGDGSTNTPSTGNTLQSGTGIGRLPGSLQDTPQTVNVVSERQLKEQNTTTVDQALRNVPGVTVNVGEGGGGMNGDQFRIRGFQAKGDLYVDGLRDFGVYVRDSFAVEQVEVIKGSSSESFGMGTTGGVINLQQKKAHKGNETYIEGSIGTDNYYRTMIDVNQQINSTTAMRAVGLYHDQDFADRDHLYSERFGFLGSLAFGLGTDTTLTVNYFHQDGERMPDLGVPILDPDGVTGPKLGKPVTEFGVPRSNFYGKVTDQDDYNVDMITSRFSKKVNSSLTISNDTRLAWYSRDFAQSIPGCAAPDTNPGTNTCGDSVLNGTFDGFYTFNGPAGFAQDSWGAQNITTALAKFKTGGLRHELVAGVDVFYQDDDRVQMSVYNSAGVLQPGTGSNVKNPGNLGTIGSPIFGNTSGYTVEKDYRGLKKAEAYDVGLFASDRVWLTHEFSVAGGLRWDTYNANYRATNPATGSWSGSTPATGPGSNPAYTNGASAADVDTNSEFVSPKLSVQWEPAENQTYYAGWSKSYSPVGQFITNDNNSVSVTPGQNNQDPEENELWEIGAKVSTPDGRLGFSAALFRQEKGNATYADPGTGDVVASGEEQRVQGIELGVTGSVTQAWIVQAAYAYYDSEILFNPEVKNATTGAITTPENVNKGNRVSFVPENSASIWTTYEISKHLSMSGKWLVGGGVTYSDSYYVNSGNTSIVPSTFQFDAMTSYELDGWRFAVNGYNLSDELNYSSAIGNRATVAPGRSAVFTIGKKF
jgi:catecholate siderophore receptor